MYKGIKLKPPIFELGEFGVIYFIDFDTVRARQRNVHIQILGE